MPYSRIPRFLFGTPALLGDIDAVAVGILDPNLSVTAVLRPVRKLDGRIQLTELLTDFLDAFDLEAVMINANVALLLRHGAMNLQAIEVEITVADIKRIGAVLLVVPDLVHAEYQAVKARKAPIILGAHSHVSDCWHI